MTIYSRLFLLALLSSLLFMTFVTYEGMCSSQENDETRLSKKRPSPNCLRNSNEVKRRKIRESTEEEAPLIPPKQALERITTHQEHVSTLKNVIRESQKRLLVSSYKIDWPTLKFIENDLKDAINRGVKIEFYSNSDPKNKPWEGTRKSTLSHLRELGISHTFLKSHAKILAADFAVGSKFAVFVIGSFNWLVDWKGFENSTNGSFVYRGKNVFRMINRFYQYKWWEKRPSPKPAYQSKPLIIEEDGFKLYFLDSLMAHRGLFQDAFRLAKYQLIVLSPFLYKPFRRLSETNYEEQNSNSLELPEHEEERENSSHLEFRPEPGDKGYNRDLPWISLLRLVQEGVQISLVFDKKHLKLSELGYLLDPKHIGRFQGHQNVKVYAPQRLFHAKTLIFDGNMSEGSFNWHSAVRDDSDKTHNHEVSLFVQGTRAQTFVDDFLNSSFAQQFKDKKRSTLLPISIDTRLRYSFQKWKQRLLELYQAGCHDTDKLSKEASDTQVRAFERGR